jgi:hypothetical protein
MIVVILNKNSKETLHQFDTLTDALVFARSHEAGTSFKIREDRKLLAKGKLEEIGENYDELEEDFDEYE